MTRTTTLKAAITVVALTAAPALTGCSSAGEGAFSGAGLGALTGLVLGSFSGDAGEGALIGTAAGAVIGGVIGDQNERDAYHSQQQAEAYRSGRVIYRDAPRETERRDDGWGDRYGQASPPQSTTYNEYHYYEQAPQQPRVVIRYDDRPSYRSRTRYSTRYSYPRRSSYRWNWGYSNDNYCR